MNIVLAFDSFKESLTSLEAGACFAQGFERVFPETGFVTISMADGGEGTAEALVRATGGSFVPCKVHSPLGAEISSEYALLGDGKTAVIETAKAVGLPLVPIEKRNPLLTTSYGAGELIMHARNAGLSRFIITLGGSATVDGGLGLSQALGVNFYDASGTAIPPLAGGEQLSRVARINSSLMDKRLKKCSFIIATDVTNTLLGPQGAAAIFGPQKGATPAMVETLEAGMARFASVIKSDTGVSVESLPGAGAAGGMALLLLALFKATIEPGIAMVLRESGFSGKCAGASLIVTGEGRVDGQTIHGKTVAGIAREGKRLGIPVAVVAGSVLGDISALYEAGVHAVFPLAPGPITLEESLAQASQLITGAGERVARALLLARAVKP